MLARSDLADSVAPGGQQKTGAGEHNLHSQSVSRTSRVSPGRKAARVAQRSALCFSARGHALPVSPWISVSRWKRHPVVTCPNVNTVFDDTSRRAAAPSSGSSVVGRIGVVLRFETETERRIGAAALADERLFLAQEALRELNGRLRGFRSQRAARQRFGHHRRFGQPVRSRQHPVVVGRDRAAAVRPWHRCVRRWADFRKRPAALDAGNLPVGIRPASTGVLRRVQHEPWPRMSLAFVRRG